MVNTKSRPESTIYLIAKRTFVTLPFWKGNEYSMIILGDISGIRGFVFDLAEEGGGLACPLLLELAT